MKLNETVPYSGATPQQVFDLICDEGFRGHVCERIHAISHDVTVKRAGDTADITINRVMPADMPDFIKKVTGETVSVVQTEAWGAADAFGARRGTIKVQITGQPASMTGTTVLRATGDRTDLSLDGEVQVKIPFLGRKIEPEVAKAIVAALRTEGIEGAARLNGSR